MLNRYAVVAVVLVAAALHQDFWLWGDRGLVFGFLPAGLAYHAAYTAAMIVLMAVLVRVAWPLDEDDVTPAAKDAAS